MEKPTSLTHQMTSRAVIGAKPVYRSRKLARIGISENHIKVLIRRYLGVMGTVADEFELPDGCELEDIVDKWIDLAVFQGLVDPHNYTNYRSEQAQDITESLSLMEIPEDAQASAIEKLFEVLDAAVTPDLPAYLDIFERAYIEPSCAICLEDYLEDEQYISQLPCGHRFHEDCTSKWLETSLLCPICRLDMSSLEHLLYDS